MSNQNKPARQQGQPASVQLQQTHIKGEIFQSNYPPPEMMEKYAQIDPAFPMKLLEMANKEGDHRRKLESRITGWAIFLDTLGTICALAAVAGVLYVGYLFMTKGFDQSGAAIIISASVAMAIAFLTRGKKTSKGK